jgi:tetratricopeptide (TPR) repeat protein
LVINVVMAASLTNISDPYRHGLALAESGRHAEAIDAFERALSARPDDARVLFALGRTADAIGHRSAAESFYRRVLDQEPDRTEALVALANLMRKGARLKEIVELLKPAIERNPLRAELWMTLASALREAGDAATAETFYREALRLHPSYAQALGNLADLLADKGNVHEALDLYYRALVAAPHNPQARLNRALLFLMRGELMKGWRDYEYRLKIKERIIAADHGLPAWSGKAARGKTLLVTAEQGIGDQIMFASVIPEIAASLARSEMRVILEAEPRLVPLFSRSFADVAVAPARSENRGGTIHASYDWLARYGGAQTAIAVGSLPGLWRKELSAFPKPHVYLVADLQESARWKEWLDTQRAQRPFVGLCWRSGHAAGLRATQYAPLELWAEFIRASPGTLVSLQYDVRGEELETLKRLSGRSILVPPGLDQKQEIDRTSAMISTLDATVSAPTSVSWIAAALGVPTFKILYSNSWTAFGQDCEPFAPSCRCMMPKSSGDWRDAFARTTEALSLLPPRGAPPAP